MWAPWRATHVGKAEKDHSFLSRVAKEHNDRENLIVYRGKQVFVLLNKYPYNCGHLMIAPYREVATYVDLTLEERHELTEVIAYCMSWLQTALAPDGFNVGLNVGAAAGAGFPKHLHMHVVPRWTSDTNFMPVTAQTKVLPEELDSTWEKVNTAVQKWESSSGS